MKVTQKISRLAAGSAIVAVAALATAGLAQADGKPGKRVAYEKPWDWGGLYFGVHSGWQWSNIDASNADNFVSGGVNSSSGGVFGFDHSSPVAGGHIGIQHQFGLFVLGIEGSITSTYRNNLSTLTCFANGTAGDAIPFGNLAPGGVGVCGARLDDILTIGPRLGYAMGKWMPYLTGGYANAAVSLQGRNTAGNVVGEEARARLGGWFIGAGVDMALSHGWTVGLEYRHYDFGSAIDAAYSPVAPTGTTGFQEHVRFDTTSDLFTVRASWKLGRPEPAVPLK